MRRALLVLALAGPACAQDAPSYDDQIIPACLAERGSDAESCIGIAASRCQFSGGGSSTVGMSFCFDAEWQQWDRMLNATYQALLAQETAEDAEMRELGASAPAQVAPLREMQRAWVAFRDASCDFEAVQWGGGTGGGPAATRCMMEMTARQALALPGWIRDDAQ